MQLGVYTLTDIVPGATAAERVQDVVDFGVAADELGLDVFGIGEHHTPRFAVSSPAVVLSAIAGRSRSIILTSAVTVLSVLDPVRLHQDFAQLDLISGGRSEITVGRSAYAEPFAIFGVPVEQYDAVFEEKLDLLLALRAGGPITWAGASRPPLRAAMIPPGTARPLPLRLGVGGTPASAERAGRLGLPMTLALLGGAPGRARPIVDLYRRAAADHGQDASHLGVGIASHFFVGATSQGARDTFYPYYRTYFAEGLGRHLDRATFDQMAGPHGPLVVGSAQEVADAILQRDQLLGLDRFLGQIDLGGQPRALVLDSLERFATEVAPAIRAAGR